MYGAGPWLAMPLFNRLPRTIQPPRSIHKPGHQNAPRIGGFRQPSLGVSESALGRWVRAERNSGAVSDVQTGKKPTLNLAGQDDLNAQAEVWCLGQAADRPCPEDRALRVREAFDQERPRLLALSDNPFDGEFFTDDMHQTMR